MRSCIYEYKTKLEKQIGELMKLPVSERNANLVDNLVDKWNHIREIESYCDETSKPITTEEINYWNQKMKNSDGTYRGHWTVDQTTPIQNQLGANKVSKEIWNVAMNMMYSDYSEVAKKYNCNTPQFFGDLTYSFLYDLDGGDPIEKISAYYHSIIK